MSVTHTTICNLVAGAWFCLDLPRLCAVGLVAGVVLIGVLVQGVIDVYLSKTKELP